MKMDKKFFSKEYFFGLKNTNYVNYNLFDNRFRWRSIISAIKKYGIGGRMLDAGCALGFLLKKTSPYFDEVYGFDISAYGITQAKKILPDAKLEVIDLDEDVLPYPDRYFDFITAMDVLEHTQSIEKSLGKIISKLKDEGTLIISVPLRDTLPGRIGNIFDRDASHSSVPSRRDLYRILEKLNLDIVKKSYFTDLIFFKLRGIPLEIELTLKKKINTHVK